jgi:hypothetical protein
MVVVDGRKGAVRRTSYVAENILYLNIVPSE